MMALRVEIAATCMLTLMLLISNFANTKKTEQIMATLGYGYLSEGTLLFNEYQHDRVLMVFKILCILIFGVKVALALEGLRASLVVEAMLHHITCETTTQYYMRL